MRTIAGTTYGFLYAVIVLINIPINKWLSFNCPQWSNGEYHLYDAFFVLQFSELLSCLIVFAVICVVVYFVSGIIACRNYCYIPLTEEEIKNKGFKMQLSILPTCATYVLMDLKKLGVTFLLMMKTYKKC